MRSSSSAGVAYAATNVAKNSVGTAQLRRRSITNGKFHPSSVGWAALGAGIRGELGSIPTPPTRLHLAVAGTIQENFQVDSGSNPREPGLVQSGNLQIPIPAGETVLGGPPGVPTGTFFRTHATLIFSTATQTASIQIAAIANGTSASCNLDGIGIVAE